MSINHSKTNHVLKHNLNVYDRLRDTQRDAVSVQEAAQYVADLVLEMRNIAKGANLVTLQGLLEVAYYEAFAAANRVSIPDGEEERLHALGEDARRAEGDE